MEDEKNRKDDAIVAELLSMMRSMMNDFNMQAEKLICIDKKLDNVLAAFPVGGLVEHRMFHEQALVHKKSSIELKNSVISSLARWGILGTLGIVIAALVLYVQVKMKV